MSEARILPNSALLDRVGLSKICATVTTSFEAIAASECEEKYGSKVQLGRGKIYFSVHPRHVHTLNQLKSVDNLAVMVGEIDGYCNPQETLLSRLLDLPNELDWKQPLLAWHLYTGKPYPTLPDLIMSRSSFSHDEAAACEESASSHTNIDDYKAIDTATPSFRVTCNRAGKDHQFTSMDCAAKFGGAINDLLKWRVDLSNSDVNVILNIVENSINVSVALTSASLHKRNIIQFGPTALRPTIAYNMLRLANIQNGDIVCDPMAGGGSISIEGAINWKNSFHICGDNFPAAGLRTIANRDYASDQNKIKALSMDTATWDVACLPLRRNSIDVVVSDMPFGKRLGNKHKNWKLYDNALSEMARICRQSTGRAVLLTQDNKVMTKILQQYSRFWRKRHCYWINIGGLTAAVYVLTRTEVETH